eukprot:gene9227-8302_t
MVPAAHTLAMSGHPPGTPVHRLVQRSVQQHRVGATGCFVGRQVAGGACPYLHTQVAAGPARVQVRRLHAGAADPAPDGAVS